MATPLLLSHILSFSPAYVSACNNPSAQQDSITSPCAAAAVDKHSVAPAPPSKSSRHAKTTSKRINTEDVVSFPLALSAASPYLRLFCESVAYYETNWLRVHICPVPVERTDDVGTYFAHPVNGNDFMFPSFFWGLNHPLNPTHNIALNRHYIPSRNEHNAGVMFAPRNIFTADHLSRTTHVSSSSHFNLRTNGRSSDYDSFQQRQVENKVLWVRRVRVKRCCLMGDGLRRSGTEGVIQSLTYSLWWLNRRCPARLRDAFPQIFPNSPFTTHYLNVYLTLENESASGSVDLDDIADIFSVLPHHAKMTAKRRNLLRGVAFDNCSCIETVSLPLRHSNVKLLEINFTSSPSAAHLFFNTNNTFSNGSRVGVVDQVRLSHSEKASLSLDKRSRELASSIYVDFYVRQRLLHNLHSLNVSCTNVDGTQLYHAFFGELPTYSDQKFSPSRTAVSTPCCLQSFVAVHCFNLGNITPFLEKIADQLVVLDLSYSGFILFDPEASRNLTNGTEAAGGDADNSSSGINSAVPSGPYNFLRLCENLVDLRLSGLWREASTSLAHRSLGAMTEQEAAAAFQRLQLNFFSCVTKLSKLRVLEIDGNPFLQLFPNLNDEIAATCQMVRSLEVLSCAQCPRLRRLANLKYFTQLRKLNLRGTEVDVLTDARLFIPRLKHLNEFYFNWTSMGARARERRAREDADADAELGLLGDEGVEHSNAANFEEFLAAHAPDLVRLQLCINDHVPNIHDDGPAAGAALGGALRRQNNNNNINDNNHNDRNGLHHNNNVEPANEEDNRDPFVQTNLDWVEQLPSLSVLGFSMGSAFVPTFSLSALSSLKHLTHLSFSYCNSLTDSIISSIFGNLSHHADPVTGHHELRQPTMKSLRVLQLDGCAHLRDPRFLLQFPRLEILKINATAFDSLSFDGTPASHPFFHSLREIECSRMRTIHDMRFLTRYPNLAVVLAEHCSFTFSSAVAFGIGAFRAGLHRSLRVFSVLNSSAVLGSEAVDEMADANILGFFLRCEKLRSLNLNTFLNDYVCCLFNTRSHLEMNPVSDTPCRCRSLEYLDVRVPSVFDTHRLFNSTVSSLVWQETVLRFIETQLAELLFANLMPLSPTVQMSPKSGVSAGILTAAGEGQYHRVTRNTGGTLPQPIHHQIGTQTVPLASFSRLRTLKVSKSTLHFFCHSLTAHHSVLSTHSGSAAATVLLSALESLSVAGEDPPSAAVGGGADRNYRRALSSSARLPPSRQQGSEGITAREDGVAASAAATAELERALLRLPAGPLFGLFSHSITRLELAHCDFLDFDAGAAVSPEGVMEVSTATTSSVAFSFPHLQRVNVNHTAVTSLDFLRHCRLLVMVSACNCRYLTSVDGVFYGYHPLLEVVAIHSNPRLNLFSLFCSAAPSHTEAAAAAELRRRACRTYHERSATSGAECPDGQLRARLVPSTTASSQRGDGGGSAGGSSGGIGEWPGVDFADEPMEAGDSSSVDDEAVRLSPPAGMMPPPLVALVSDAPSRVDLSHNPSGQSTHARGHPRPSRRGNRANPHEEGIAAIATDWEKSANGQQDGGGGGGAAEDESGSDIIRMAYPEHLAARDAARARAEAAGEDPDLSDFSLRFDQSSDTSSEVPASTGGMSAGSRGGDGAEGGRAAAAEAEEDYELEVDEVRIVSVRHKPVTFAQNLPSLKSLSAEDCMPIRGPPVHGDNSDGEAASNPRLHPGDDGNGGGDAPLFVIDETEDAVVVPRAEVFDGFLFDVDHLVRRLLPRLLTCRFDPNILPPRQPIE